MSWNVCCWVLGYLVGCFNVLLENAIPQKDTRSLIFSLIGFISLLGISCQNHTRNSSKSLPNGVVRLPQSGSSDLGGCVGSAISIRGEENPFIHHCCSLRSLRCHSLWSSLVSRVPAVTHPAGSQNHTKTPATQGPSDRASPVVRYLQLLFALPASYFTYPITSASGGET